MNLTQDEQDEQTLSVFDLQDEMDAMRQAIMDYECLESSRLWEEYMEMARQQLTPSDSEEEEEEEPNRLDILCQVALQEQPTQLIGRKRRYSEIEQSSSEEEEEDFCEQDCGCDLCEEGIPEEYEEDDDGIGKCGFRCDGRCPICEDGGFDSRDEI
jgi:hypothetical protein